MVQEDAVTAVDPVLVADDNADSSHRRRLTARNARGNLSVGGPAGRRAAPR
jgi:hypothetical protein